MKAIMEIEFPCGYYYCFVVRGRFTVEINNDLDDLPLCPLHGKKCKKT